MENKSSKILIIIGIAIAIIGGIVFMNSFAETQKKTANADHPMMKLIEKSEKSMKISHEEPLPEKIVFPLMIIILGAGIFGAGVLSGKPHHSKNLPPGIG
jgi:H+/gluconate symporter-like permease